MRRGDLIKLAAASGAYVAAPSVVRAQGALETLHLAAIPSDALTPLYYGIKNNYFQQVGIDLQIMPAASGTAATTAVIAGTYELANTSLVPAFEAHTRGIPILIVAPQAMYSPEVPFSLLQIAADSPYKAGADLNGRICACGALNDISQLVTRGWVDKTGGDSRTLKFVEIPSSATDAALVQHRVAAGILLEPLLDESIAAGHTKTIGDAFGAIAHSYMTSAYVGRSDWAAAHPDLLRRFVRAANQAAVYTNVHPTETAAMMSEITKIPLPIMQKMKRVVCGTSFDPQLIQPLIDAAAKYKQIPAAFPAKDMYFTDALK